MSTPKLNAALCKASLEIKSLPLDGTMDTGANSGRRRIQYDYVTAESVLEAVRGPLAVEGVSVCLISSDFVEGRAAVRVCMRVAHTSGEEIVISKTRPIDKSGADGTSYDGAETRIVKRLLKFLLQIPAMDEEDERKGAVTDSRPSLGMPQLKTLGDLVTPRPRAPKKENPVVTNFVEQVKAASNSFVEENVAEFEAVEAKHQQARDPNLTAGQSPELRALAISVFRACKTDLESVGVNAETRALYYQDLLGAEIADAARGVIIDLMTKEKIDFLKTETAKYVAAAKAADPEGVAA
jgi:hypothetical protein